MQCLVVKGKQVDYPCSPVCHLFGDCCAQWNPNMEVVVNEKTVWVGKMSECPHIEHEQDKQEKKKAIIEAANNLIKLCRNTNDEEYSDFVEDVLYSVVCLDYIEEK